MNRLLYIILICISINKIAIGQEKTNLDSLIIELERLKKEKLLISKPLPAINDPDFENFGLKSIPLFEKISIPERNFEFDFNKILDNRSLRFYTEDISPHSINSHSFGLNIFNKSAFEINDKFTLGGNNFGANSIFDKPKLNQSINDMSIKGASMFLQYKVSDKFKVETRVSISNKQHPGF